jgi:phosphotransferase system HPr (HPr) family protein
LRFRIFTLSNASGLHARPATTLVQAAAGLKARVRIANLDRDPLHEVDGKSIISVLTLGASRGHRIKVTVDGEDEESGLDEIALVLESGLGESAVESRRQA